MKTPNAKRPNPEKISNLNWGKLEFRSPGIFLAFGVLAFGIFVSPLRAQPAPHKVERAPASAILVPLSENWRLDGDVPLHALLISLQGLANRDYPRLYLEYPKNWQWEIVHPLDSFLD